MQIKIITLKFPELKLQTRDAHKLRGYFSTIFQDISTLLHNHQNDGKPIYQYPLIQYKVVDGVPYIIGMEQGAEVLEKLYLNLKEIDINGKKFPLIDKEISIRQVETGVSPQFHRYQFKTLWLALNQENFDAYRQLPSELKKEKLVKILIGNTLAFSKGINYFVEKELKIEILRFSEGQTLFKGKKFIGFRGEFSINFKFPDLIGIGKSVSRGFGTIVRVKEAHSS